MLFYALYVAGYLGCLLLPRRLCYWVARGVADYCYWRSPKDRESVRKNLQAVLETPDVSDATVREVFHNFAIYLVDFFRFGKLDRERVKRLVRIEGLDTMKGALDSGQGAIGLTAHLGNYELAGAVLALLGLPVSAVVLIHQNPWVDAFFTRQRQRVGVKGIPITVKTRKAAFKNCLSSLQGNEILALVGDRDFFDCGMTLTLFGKEVKIPTGPAAFSVKTGAPIVPGFLIRQQDGTYRFILESPIPFPQGLPPREAIRQMTEECLQVMARYIRRYPTQWYMFQEFWRPGPAVIL